MRVLQFALGAAFVLAPGFASATTIYDSVNGLAAGVFNSGAETGNVSWDWVDPTANGPNASEFTLAVASTLTSVSLELSADTPNDGGSIVVVLMSDNGGSPPYTSVTDPSSGSGLNSTFLDTTILGTIADSSLSQNSALVTINSSIVLAAGNYWIGTETGLISGTADEPDEEYGSGQWWWTQPDSSVPETNNFNSIGAPGPFAVGGADNPGAYELIVDASASVPEPTTLAVLGAGLASLGYVRRRRAKKD